MVYEYAPYAVGLCKASVCSTLTLKETGRRLNSDYPTGIASNWIPASSPTSSDWKPNPRPCDHHPETHKHYLFEC